MKGIGSLAGKALKQVREQQSKTQDDVARAARRAGLAWTRATVAALEGGRRELSLDGIARLPSLLYALTGRHHAVRLQSTDEDGAIVDVIGPDGRVLLRSEDPLIGSRLKPAVEGMAENERALRVWPNASRHEFEAAHIEKGGDAEAKAARRFRVPSLAVALAARKVWKRSLSAERDRRVAAEAPAGATPRALQALRGHVTRQLLAELEPVLQAAKPLRHRK